MGCGRFQQSRRHLFQVTVLKFTWSNSNAIRCHCLKKSVLLLWIQIRSDACELSLPFMMRPFVYCTDFPGISATAHLYFVNNTWATFWEAAATDCGVQRECANCAPFVSRDSSSFPQTDVLTVASINFVHTNKHPLLYNSHCICTILVSTFVLTPLAIPCSFMAYQCNFYQNQDIGPLSFRATLNLRAW
jgi:hypothetical protein